MGLVSCPILRGKIMGLKKASQRGRERRKRRIIPVK
ncbi:hypothetical protein SLEP1_g48718 [Rubroshorea leprosula]|uniref:Uncharacterized protein n=1 Tax=Rubroshorea leprosula TaxID=152421 RepID=A0AAV5LUJ3_9ROSI|nr:hypothetical protein SLEP1_g48718 [Rubroshorea leprosula]